MSAFPSWTWRIWGESSPRVVSRWLFKFLRWSVDSHSLSHLLISSISLLYGIWAVAQYASGHLQDAPVLVIAACAVGIAFGLKSLTSNVATVLLGEGKTPGGTPLVYRFHVVVPQVAERIAIVGQTLSGCLGSDYNDTLFSINDILSRKNKAGENIAKEIWFILQSPRALWRVQPLAFEHLKTITLPGIRKLCNELKNGRDKIVIACHPASTLSMIAIDWHKKDAFAAVSPKLQILSKIHSRLSLIVRRKDYEAVASEFDRFVFNCENRELPGAFSCSLDKAGDMLEQALTEEEADPTHRQGRPLIM